MNEVIEFWHPEDQHGFLSNFYEAKIFAEGRYWKTSEHFYQAMKHQGTELFGDICCEPTPKKAKDLARSIPSDITEQQKIKIMRSAIRAKFTQNPMLKYALLGTGNKKLVEASNTDAYWGYGPNRDGINMMGLLLMELRTDFANQE